MATEASTSCDAARTSEELERDGWQRRFVADEPRLGEAAEAYRELGFAVLLVPLEVRGADCSECAKAGLNRCRIIYVRRRSPEKP